MRILIVDDSRSSLAYLAQVVESIEGGHAVDTFTRPLLALEACATEQHDLILVDHIMPEIDGIEFTRRLRNDSRYETVPVVMVTSDAGPEIRRQAIASGATDFVTKPFDAVELQARVRNLLALRGAQVELSKHAETLTEKIEAATKHLIARQEEVIWRLAKAIEYRDGETGEHVSRVARISRIIAEAIGLGPAHCRTIYLAAPLHDIGKIGIRDAILGKKGKLDDDEMRRMREHVSIGARILGNGDSEIIRTAELIAQSHHERWDGAGYPDRLSGTDIPIEARIVAIADVFDALCSERPYKKAWPLSKAYDEIVSLSGAHFDPQCVAAFQAKWSEISAIMKGPHRNADTAAEAAAE